METGESEGRYPVSGVKGTLARAGSGNLDRCFNVKEPLRGQNSRLEPSDPSYGLPGSTSALGGQLRQNSRRLKRANNRGKRSTARTQTKEPNSRARRRSRLQAREIRPELCYELRGRRSCFVFEVRIRPDFTSNFAHFVAWDVTAHIRRFDVPYASS